MSTPKNSHAMLLMRCRPSRWEGSNNHISIHSESRLIGAIFEEIIHGFMCSDHVFWNCRLPTK